MSEPGARSGQLKKPSFLSVFFIVLGIALAVAVWLRIRSFRAGETLAPATRPAEVASASPSDLATATIVDADPAPLSPTSSGSAKTSAAAARERRYRELLANPPSPSGEATGGPVRPAVANPQPVEKPSLIDRVVKPIGEALGLKPPPPPSKPTQQASTQPSTSGDASKPEQPQQARDEDADTTAPRLLSADFSPPQVRDGEQTSLTVVATDDLSGVRSVSGVVISPSGAQQGFACQREGEANRFISRISVPKEAAEGVWTVRYLTLTDNANNSVNLNTGQGTLPPSASFRVVSPASDTRGPTLKAVWLDSQSMAAGEKNQLYVEAEDDKSGVGLVSGVFVSPQKQARIGFGCRSTSPTLWQCAVTPPTCVDCGAWQLEQIQLQDKANNMTTVRTDNQLVAAVRLSLFGKDCDSAAPTLTSVMLDPPVVSNAEASVIRVTAVATDDQCGVASLSGQAMPPGGGGSSRIYFPFRPSADGTTFTGEIVIPKHAANGVWTIAWIQALDKGHNMRAYSASDPVIARVTFRVE
ncbi:MAG TPA: hypothetical protein VHL59_05090 [Thermoanaerobaculia bacterium]|nr:hypothetical protein [Thermoanaerobaculia bacterium]